MRGVGFVLCDEAIGAGGRRQRKGAGYEGLDLVQCREFLRGKGCFWRFYIKFREGDFTGASREKCPIQTPQADSAGQRPVAAPARLRLYVASLSEAPVAQLDRVLPSEGIRSFLKDLCRRGLSRRYPVFLDVEPQERHLE